MATGSEARAKVTISRVGQVASYELTLPWETLGLTGPPVGTPVGFDLAVNDKDEKGPRHGLELTPGIVVTKNPKDFGVLVLQ